MKTINVNEIIKTVKELSIEANYYLPNDVKEAIEKAEKNEKWPIANNILNDASTLSPGIIINHNTATVIIPTTIIPFVSVSFGFIIILIVPFKYQPLRNNYQETASSQPPSAVSLIIPSHLFFLNRFNPFPYFFSQLSLHNRGRSILFRISVFPTGFYLRLH